MSNKRSRIKTSNVPEVDDSQDVDADAVTDSEDEYTETERNLLKKVRTRRTSDNYDSDDEVYGLHIESEDQDVDEDEEADSMESDIEGLQEDHDLPNEKAWGKKKRAYYSTDYVDPDYASASQKDIADAEMEEQEARSIQKRLAEQLDDVDFGLDFIQIEKEDSKSSDETKHIVKTDLSKLNRRQKQALMQKESPEFMALVNDFKDRMTEARDVLAPFLKLIEKGTVPQCPAASFVRTKYHLSLNYCVNISFYLMLKAKRLPVYSHPVIKRLAQYRQLLNQLEVGQESLMKEIQDIVRAEKEGEPLYDISNGSQMNTKKLNKRKTTLDESSKHLKYAKKEIVNASLPKTESDNEQQIVEDDTEMESVENEEEENLENHKENELLENNTQNPMTESDGKRAITYQMAKNKGLTPHRKKEQRNPRVKHRNKYRKAKIRRKGAVREVRKEVSRYSGEISGIKAGVKKSRKLK